MIPVLKTDISSNLAKINVISMIKQQYDNWKTYFTNKIDGTDHLKMNNDGLFIKDFVREKY